MRGASFAMKWLRSNARQLSLLALFALALQFGLSFGHHHRATALAATAQAAPTLAAHASTPDTDHDQDTPGDLCAICATIAMADTLVDAAPPLLALPQAFVIVPVAPSRETAAPVSRRHIFQSRAPPLS
jgi:hypothetical protein